jgi:rod shape determining protein RodA
LGTALTLLFIWLIMLFGANISLFKVFLMGVMAVIIIPLSWNFLKQYQKDRIMTFLNPTQDPLGVGYNVIQSMIAVGSGQIFGRGLGHGTQSRLQFLPEFRTDFIFASIAEELGLFGALLMFVLYGVILLRALRIAYLCNNLFGTLLIFGGMGMFLFQTVVNVGMNMGILPITGITLPLISYGGSSLITTMICLGFIASVGRYKTRRQEIGI